MYDMILPDLELDVTHIVENGKYFSKLALLSVLSSFLTRGYARAYHELLQGLRYANESLTHS